MTRSVHARWWQAAGACALAVLVAVELVLTGHPVLAVPAGAALLWLAYVVSPFRPTSGAGHWQAQDRLVQHGCAIVYWRPGCRHCVRLRLRLTRARLATCVSWVDIWADPEGAAYVRDLNDGDETVPTVILPDGSAVTNPEPGALIAVLRQGSERAAPATATSQTSARPPDPHPHDRSSTSPRPGDHRRETRPESRSQRRPDSRPESRPARHTPHHSPVRPGSGADG